MATTVFPFPSLALGTSYPSRLVHPVWLWAAHQYSAGDFYPAHAAPRGVSESSSYSPQGPRHPTASTCLLPQGSQLNLRWSLPGGFQHWSGSV